MKNLLHFFLIVGLLISAGPVTAAVQSDTGRTFYVDSVSGSDDNKGTSEDETWASLAKVNSMRYEAGDRILFKAGTVYSGQLKPKGSGQKGKPIIIDAYDAGDRPRIDGRGNVNPTLLLQNVEYYEISNLEITNTGPTRAAGRMGVYIHVNNFGTAHNIKLKNLYIHDVNGSNVKSEGGGYGIRWNIEGDTVQSRFDGLLIEDCHLLRCDRNGIIGGGTYWRRDIWNPSTNIVIRGNLLEDIGGDGIVPICCDGCLVEYNILRGGRQRARDAAAGIWPWSCDNTIIQFNEVSNMKGTHDGQAFDSDWNCSNSLFQYNYSHDNEGGFFLACNKSDVAMPTSVGNVGTIVRYNISQNDGEYASGPIFELSGSIQDTLIYNNVVYIGGHLDILLVNSWNWEKGWADNTNFYNNVFYVDGNARYNFGGITNTVFENNVFYGNHANPPADPEAIKADPMLIAPGSGKDGLESLDGYKLQTASPCQKAGKILKGPVACDFYGNKIDPEAVPDIGVHALTSIKPFEVFGEAYKFEDIAVSDAVISLENNALRIRTGHTRDYPGITFKAPAAKWDLSQYQWLRLLVQNYDSEPVTVNLRVDSCGSDGKRKSITEHVKVASGKVMPLMVTVGGLIRLDKKVNIIGMRSDPFAGRKIDPTNITQMIVFVGRPKQNHDFSISHITSGGKVNAINNEDLFPFIDKYGQFIHKDWQGKCYSVDDIKTKGAQEQHYLKQNPGPTGRNKYGGWLNGPKLKSTGFFRVEKYQGKWWLVDPDGLLFWSHGINCVGNSISTPITDRQNYFEKLPQKGSLLAEFYGRGNWAPHGYYQQHRPYRTFDFGGANLLRKYGRDWKSRANEVTQHRLRSWGLNTIGNWSDRNIYLMRRTPYVTTIRLNSKKLEGSEGYWSKFPDVFDKNFRNGVHKALQREKGKTIDDPWCIGYFVDNELSWGDEVSLAVAALKSPAEQEAKKAFISDLKTKYETLEKFNAAWGKKYKSWDELLESTEDPKVQKEQTREDLRLFYIKTAETYFRIIKEEMNKIAPHRLYLGCRFAWVNDLASRAASKYCDVVSYNRYTYGIEDLKLPTGSMDKPLINGEFHFGALDRGMFHTGLRKSKDQIERSQHYKNYVQSALLNPAVVGTHWFQYRDQATTGRGDGENYQIGFVDVCDKPYYEIVRAASQIGEKMYQYRFDNTGGK